MAPRNARSRRAERKRHEDVLLERRRRAAAEIDVMRDTIAKRTEQERVRQGAPLNFLSGYLGRNVVQFKSLVNF